MGCLLNTVRMLLKSGYRHVYISRKFAMKHGFIPADAAPGHYGYGGLVNIGTWPITLTPSSAFSSTHPPAPLAPANFKVKRVDYFYSNWSKAWKYRNTSSKVKADALQTVGNGDSNAPDPWQGYCFVVVRKLPQPVDGEQGEPTFQVVVKSPYLLIACKDVIQKVQGVSWTAEPLEVRASRLRLHNVD